MKVVFFGTPELSANILEQLISDGLDVCAIVTRPDQPKGRCKKLLPSPVKALALEKWPNIPIFTPQKASSEEFVETLRPYEADVFLVVSFGEIIKQNLLSLPLKKCINVHFSLLPKYRGAAPMQRALMDGERETGITIIEMVLKMDAGDILAMEKTPIHLETTFGQLQKKLSHLSISAVQGVLEKIEKGALQPEPQDHEKATLAPKITQEDRLIDWGRNAIDVHNQIRALAPTPGAYTFVTIHGEKKRLGIKKTLPIEELSGLPGETLRLEKDRWIVACGSGALSLLEVQLEGKKTLPVRDFLRGLSCEINIEL